MSQSVFTVYEMVLVSCGILCGRLGPLTKTLKSLESIVSQTLIHTEMIYFPLRFDALFLTDIIAPYVDVTSSSTKTDRDKDNAPSIYYHPTCYLRAILSHFL